VTYVVPVACTGQRRESHSHCYPLYCSFEVLQCWTKGPGRETVILVGNFGYPVALCSPVCDESYGGKWRFALPQEYRVGPMNDEHIDVFASRLQRPTCPTTSCVCYSTLRTATHRLPRPIRCKVYHTSFRISYVCSNGNKTK
jgi:hypothetical protein